MPPRKPLTPDDSRHGTVAGYRAGIARLIDKQEAEIDRAIVAQQQARTASTDRQDHEGAET